MKPSFLNSLRPERRKRTLIEREIRKRNVIAFACFLILCVSAYAGWRWLVKQPDELGVQQPLRAVLDQNEQLFRSYLSHKRLSKTYPVSMAAKKARVNGNIGLKSALDTAAWKLKLVRNPGDTLLISMEDIKKLPKTDLVFDFKCIEGWSQITHWGGVKFVDFVKHYRLNKQSSMSYIGLNTPDKKYYVGIDMESALHPQTLLCYELNSKPLPLNQGYPLRLIIPVKYGVKHIKRIGTLYFSNQKPPDYWAERGYDYYTGL